MRYVRCIAAVVAVVVVLSISHYGLVVRGDCPKPDQVETARIRGDVVGKSLFALQYRWLRRLFSPQGIQISLRRRLPDTQYLGNVIWNHEAVGEQIIGPSGRFDFGALPPGEYELAVGYPGIDRFGATVVLNPESVNTELLIDASPAYFCHCCGWDFEPR